MYRWSCLLVMLALFSCYLDPELKVSTEQLADASSGDAKPAERAQSKQIVPCNSVSDCASFGTKVACAPGPFPENQIRRCMACLTTCRSDLDCASCKSGLSCFRRPPQQPNGPGVCICVKTYRFESGKAIFLRHPCKTDLDCAAACGVGYYCSGGKCI